MNARVQTLEWLERYYGLLDSGRVLEAIEQFIAPGCTFRFGNAPPSGFLEEARRMSRLVRGVRHRLLTVLESDEGTIAVELEVTYIKHDGTELTLPGSLFARVRDERFLEQRAYIDQAPLLA